MKKLTLIISALALVLGMSQCKKPNAPVVNGGIKTQEITVNASNGNGGAKLNIEDDVTNKILNFKWSSIDNDQITVTCSTKTGVSGTLTLDGGSDGMTEGMFKGKIDVPTSITTDDELTFTFGEMPDGTKYASQDGTLNGTNGLKKRMCAVGKANYNEAGEYNVTMELPYAIVKLDLHMLNNSTTGNVTIAYDAVTITLANVPTTANDYYVMLPAGSKNYTFTGNAKTVVKNWDLEANKYYRKDDGSAIKIGVETHEYVDLGLSVYWATTNIGAETPEDYGNYYAWGEVETKATYGESTYKYGKIVGEYIQYTKYNATDGKDVLEVTEEVIDDAAVYNWGGDWRMPTKAEADELVDNTKCEWTWINDKANNKVGYQIVSKVEGYEGNEIFVPAAGYRMGTSMYNNETEVRLWTTKLIIPSEDPEYYPYGAGNMIYGTSTAGRVQGWNRFIGFPIRPVCPKTAK